MGLGYILIAIAHRCTALCSIVVIYLNNVVTRLIIAFAPFVTIIIHKTDLESIGTKESLISHLKRRL